MGFKSLIAKQVQGAMKILGTDQDGLAQKRVFVSLAKGVYDPVERRVVSVKTEYPGVPMTLVRFKLDDMDEEVRPTTDRVALIASLDLPVNPDENDKVEDVDGTVYTVKRILSDPADALYRLHIRMEATDGSGGS